MGMTLNELDIQSVLSLKVDIQARIIYLIGDIDEDTLRWFLPVFTMLDRGNKPITVRITSGGGDTYIGFTIYDLFRNAKNKVICEVYGYAHSIAALILQGADLRLMTELSAIMIHDTRILLHEEQIIKHKEMNLQASELKKLCDEYYTKISKRTKQDFAFIKELGFEEKVLHFEEALKYGFIDKVIKGKK
jgi:ATP-dependent Clp protease, protease subunit